MEFTPYKLLIYSIVLVVVVYFIMNYLAPLFLPQEDPVEVLKEKLDDAQFASGKSISQQLAFSAGSSITAGLFDSGSRSVNFECNDLSFCCQLNEQCGKIEWDARSIYFPSFQSATASVRCRPAAGLHACTVFFGAKPAQLELTSFPGDANFDFGLKQVYELQAKVKNAGEKIAAGEVNNTFKAYRVYQTLQGEQKDFQFELSQAVKNLYPDDEETIVFSLPREKFFLEGEYLLEFKAESVGAGFAEDSLRVNVSNLPSSCKTGLEGEAELVSGQCQRKLHCQGCLLAGACAKAWENLKGKELPLVDPEYTVEELPSSACS
jgi:hypothetical protein